MNQVGEAGGLVGVLVRGAALLYIVFVEEPHGLCKWKRRARRRKIDLIPAAQPMINNLFMSRYNVCVSIYAVSECVEYNRALDDLNNPFVVVVHDGGEEKLL